jgi:Pyridine nucleotide-disulphide oxidoreductase
MSLQLGNQGVIDSVKGNAKSRLPDYDVIVVGAGPYGLSAGAHLKSKGMGICVFGEPMEFWASKMPEGMLLRSPREASNLSDPHSAFTLEAYEAASGKEPCAPVPLDTFVSYGKWFRQQLGSDLDTRNIASVEREGELFRVTLRDGETVRSRRVLVAAGIGPFRKKPDVFKDLPASLASHCYERRAIRNFAGARVVVIGAGQSALESAALLHEAGADVEIISRKPAFKWVGIHGWLHHLGPISKMLYSKHDVGPLGISRLVAAPHLVAQIPLGMRDKIRTRAVRPAGSKWLIERLQKVKAAHGRSVAQAIPEGGSVRLKLDDGSERVVDHVIMGTGYRVDISKYEFLSPQLVSEVKQFDGYPRLGRGFRSSVPGLHFIGATAARSFGPLLYFVTGTEFACKELVSQLSRSRSTT